MSDFYCETPNTEGEPCFGLVRLRTENATMRGALADIAYSDDMTLKIAKAKADRVYKSITPQT